jgi:hypothetical protein
MGRNMPRIYVMLDNKKVEFWWHMIEVGGNINDQPITILVDSGAIHSYLNPNMVEIIQFLRSKFGKPWLVKLAIEAKRKINEMVKECPMEINGLCTRVDLNILYLWARMLASLV